MMNFPNLSQEQDAE